MLLPDKHIKISESLLGLAALVLESLTKPLSFDALMASFSSKFETPEWPAFHNAESVCLALCFLPLLFFRRAQSPLQRRPMTPMSSRSRRI